jgi:hypothetical protein
MTTDDNFSLINPVMNMHNIHNLIMLFLLHWSYNTK